MEENKPTGQTAILVVKSEVKADKADTLSHMATVLARIKKDKESFLRYFGETMGIVSAACKAVDISRETFYDWYKSDREFMLAVEKVRAMQCDYVEDKLFKLVAQDEPGSVRFFLKSRHGKYMPKQIVFNADVRSLEDIIDEDEENLNKENEPIKAENTAQPAVAGGKIAEDKGQKGTDSPVQKQQGTAVLLDKKDKEEHLAETPTGGDDESN